MAIAGERGLGSEGSPMRLAALVSVSLAMLPLAASAADGAIEINQACAVNTGCFAGDLAGLPVTITAPGSYVLTSNVTNTTLDGEAITIDAESVRLDLGGFTLDGGASTLGSTLGDGIRVNGERHGLHIHDGTVTNWGRHGINAERGDELGGRFPLRAADRLEQRLRRTPGEVLECHLVRDRHRQRLRGARSSPAAMQ